MSSATKTILVPLDASPLSETKLPVVEEYARAFGAEVILLHVMPPQSRPARALPRPFDTSSPQGAISAAEANTRTFLEMTATRLRAAGIAARPLVLSGPVAETILAVAREQEIALIILGSDVRRGLSRLFLGSVAGAVVQGAPCPTLLVRPDLDAPVTTTPLRSFAEDEARAGLLTPRVLGPRRIEVARIIGSVGRTDELGANFRPTARHPPDEERYQRIVDLAERGVQPLPPVDLFKLGYGYYVVDGHRRVAAAKQLGFDEIDANVTEYLPTTDVTAQQLFTARRRFERTCGLTSVGAARPESYPRLEALIEEFREARGLTEYKEAAERWRVAVYGDLVRRIRALRLNRYFAGERSADIVVRVADHRAAESARLGRTVTWDEALASFVATLHP
jgi:nucleotide-binding universal stress UspA family protein